MAFKELHPRLTGDLFFSCGRDKRQPREIQDSAVHDSECQFIWSFSHTHAPTYRANMTYQIRISYFCY